MIDPVAKTRSIQVNGVHLIATQPVQKGDEKRIVVVWDQTVSASAPIVFDQANSRILGGSVKIQHNLKKYTAIVEITSPLQFQDGICNPVSGSILSSLSGSLSGSETLTYIGSNQATLVDAQGNQSTITLDPLLLKLLRTGEKRKGAAPLGPPPSF